MAKRSIDHDGQRPAKVRYLEIEATDETIQKALDTIERMRRPVEVLPVPIKRLPSQARTPAEATLFDGQEAVNGEGAEVTAEAPTEEAPAQRAKRGQGPKRDRNAGLAIVKSLNLRPSGKDSLKDFVANKKPSSQMEHIAVYVYFLKRILEEQRVGFSEVFTCFDETGTRKPEDLPQTCRNAASQKGWIDTADQDDLKITTRGANLVEHELPRSGGDAESAGT